MPTTLSALLFTHSLSLFECVVLIDFDYLNIYPVDALVNVFFAVVKVIFERS